MLHAKRIKTLALKNLDYTLIAIVQSLIFISVLVTFLLSAQNVKAQDASVCTAQSLISQLPQNALDLAKTEAATVPNGKGLLWTITKDGHAPSWLYGTMHVTDPRILELKKSVTDAINRSETVVIETLDLLDPVKAQGAVMMNPELAMFTDGRSLTSDLTDKDKQFISSELEKRGISITLVSQLKPWMVMGMIATPECETNRKASGKQILDFDIIERAKSQGKSVDGLETIVEQMSAMGSLPVDFQIKGLMETLRLGELLDDVHETMIDLYLSEDIALITPALKAVAIELGQEELNDESFGEFEARIIIDRNYLMAERAEKILDTTSAFIAVGAMHLPGEEGVIELLRKRGFTVERSVLQ